MFIFRREKNTNIFPNILCLSGLKLLINEYSMSLYHEIAPLLFYQTDLEVIISIWNLHPKRGQSYKWMILTS